MFKRVNRREFCGARKYVLIEQLSSAEKVKGDSTFSTDASLPQICATEFYALKFIKIHARGSALNNATVEITLKANKYLGVRFGVRSFSEPSPSNCITELSPPKFLDPLLLAFSLELVSNLSVVFRNVIKHFNDLVYRYGNVVIQPATPTLYLGNKSVGLPDDIFGHLRGDNSQEVVFAFD